MSYSPRCYNPFRKIFRVLNVNVNYFICLFYYDFKNIIVTLVLIKHKGGSIDAVGTSYNEYRGNFFSGKVLGTSMNYRSSTS